MSSDETKAQPGDFLEVLRRTGHPFTRPVPPGTPGAAPVEDTHGTTVIAVKYDDGVINVGDRRAVSNLAVMFDRAEKILHLDDYTLIAISGSFARAMEVVRFLRHAFHYYRRSQLQSMSLEGKLAEVSRVVAANVSSVAAGYGFFIPILSAYDTDRNEGRIFFYDGMGARFESAEFGAAGSGSERIRGIFDYIAKSRGPFHDMPFDEALGEALLLLDIAADLDIATGGYGKILPLVKTINEDGIQAIPDKEIQRVLKKIGRK